MKILIDFTQIPIERTGVGVYADNLIRDLVLLIRPDDELFLLIQDDEHALRESIGVRPNVQFVLIPSKFFRSRALLLIFEQIVLPLMLRKRQIEVVHSLHYTHPLITSARRVVTIHDLTFILYPHLHTLGRRLIMPFFIRRAMKYAEGLIFVSESAKEDACRLISGGKGLKTVAPLGVDPRLFEATAGGEIDEILAKLNVERPFLLFVGTIEPRKNVVRLIQAFEAAADTHLDLELVIVGKLGWDYWDVLQAEENSRHRDRIRRLGFVTEAEKQGLLEACEILVYPSLYEGFGLPVLEAMAAGAPVITSNVSSLPEVAGDAGICLDPLDVPGLAGAIQAVLGDSEKRLSMRAAGQERAATFTWKRTAELTYKTYA